MQQVLSTLRLVRDTAVPAPTAQDVTIRSPRDVYTLMAPIADREVVENLWALALDTHHAVIGEPILITRGTINSSLVAPREVFVPVLLSMAAAVIIVHNHPSGDPTPSPEDRAVTEQLRAASRLLDIPVYDHVVMGRGRYTSFAEMGLL